MKGLFVTATDTNTGKTWVGKHLIQALQKKGTSVVPRKPVESGWNDNTTLTDAWILADAAGCIDDLNSVCPNRFKAAISPERAATLEGKTLSISELHQQCLNNLGNNDFLYVEGAGGFYSPLCSDGLNADLAVALNLPVLMVVENRLGCINQTLLSIEAIQQRGLELAAVVLNNPSEAILDSDMANFTDLQKYLDCPIVNLAHIKNNKISPEKTVLEELSSIILGKKLK